jgi:hypothetical protein
VKALGVQVVTVCKDAEVVVKMLEYVLAYVEVSVTTDSCTAAAGVAEQAAVGVVEEDASGEGSTEGDKDDEEDVAESVMVDSKTVMIWVVIVSVEYSVPVLVTVATQGSVL